MTTMWTCKFCEKPVAPNAAQCPACGGKFGVSERGYMRTRANMREDYEREKSGLPAKRVGCSIFVVPLLGAGLWFASSTLGEASEWKAFGTNNAMVTSADGKLTIQCESGEGSSRNAGITFYIEPTKTLSAPKGPFWGVFNRVKGQLIGGGQRVRFDNNRWVLWASSKGTLRDMKAGSEILFRYAKDQYLSFPLKGSSKALDTCFKLVIKQDTYAHSKVDIVGLRTGMSYSTVAKQVQSHLGEQRVNFRDTKITYVGTDRRSNSTIKMDYSATWRKQERFLDENIKILLTPDVLGKRALTIQRELFYETHRTETKAPLFGVVVEEGLKAKYGNISIWNERDDRPSGEIIWFFDPKTGKSYGNAFPPECLQTLKHFEPKWGHVTSTQHYKRYQSQLGHLVKKCGPFVRAKYDVSGQYLRNLTTTLVDVPLIFESVTKAYHHLKGQADAKAEQLLEQSEGVKPKF